MKFRINLDNIKRRLSAFNSIKIDKSIIIALALILIVTFIISGSGNNNRSNQREVVTETEFYKVERIPRTGKYFVEVKLREDIPTDLSEEIEEYLLTILTKEEIEQNVIWDIPTILMGGKPLSDFDSEEEYQKFLEEANDRYKVFQGGVGYRE